MEQATEPTTPTASLPRTGTFAHAHTLAGTLMARLAIRKLPFAVEMGEDFPSGWRVHLKYRGDQAAGLFALAALVDAPVSRAETTFGVHLDVVTRIEGVEVRASAIVSPLVEANLTGEPAPTGPATADAAQPVPLGASVLAQVSAVTPVQPVNTARLGADDVACCVRCGCTEDAACEGGCYWVPNRQLIDLCSACATAEELAAGSWAVAPADAEDGGL